jgi:hypothetical protein
MSIVLKLWGWKLPTSPVSKFEARRAISPPEVRPATAVLQVGLERATGSYAAREAQLIQEIADRKAELADVRRASSAATAALVELAIDGEAIAEELEDEESFRRRVLGTVQAHG